ncbi:MAG: aspartate/glutamate racemase family protein [Saprospiraceae bacterium]
MIGIVGGIGPMAGADLYKKIVENTVAHRDQDHLSVLLASFPQLIADRTDYLLGKSNESPANALAEVILLLENAGSKYIGIACNTAHAPQIFDPMMKTLMDKGSKAEILHLIEHTTAFIKAQEQAFERIGLLCTLGSYKTNLYQNRLRNASLTPVVLDIKRHNELAQVPIYHPDYGLKCISEGHPEAIIKLNTAIAELQALGAEAVILGCTEIGMVEEQLDFHGMAAFNPNTILARELIRRVAPEKLKP